MTILWDTLSEKQQEWLYTLISFLIVLITLVRIFTSPSDFASLALVYLFLGLFVGYFFFIKGRFKLLGRPLVQRCSRCHTQMFAKYKGTFYCSTHLEEKISQIQAEKGKLGRTEKRFLKKIQSSKREVTT
ncbi:MAG: hypothetical protein ACFFFG_05005 [Candidatus Thorarchaeota archaeon]